MWYWEIKTLGLLQEIDLLRKQSIFVVLNASKLKLPIFHGDLSSDVQL